MSNIGSTLEESLNTLEDIMNSPLEPEQMAEDFMRWVRSVTMLLSPPELAEEAGRWEKATDDLRFVSDEASFPIQVRLIRATLLGIMDRLRETEPSAELIPIDIVNGTRDYVVKIAEQANGCYGKGWYDACAVMLRRLIEILIVDSYEARGKLSDIRQAGYPTISRREDNQPTASDIRHFLEQDLPRLEGALKDVQVSLGGSPLTSFSATTNWASITSQTEQIPENISTQFGMIMEARERARSGDSSLTSDQLIAALQAISGVLEFLHKQFPSAGIEVPERGEIMSLRHLVERYLSAPDSYWHVEQSAKAAVRKIKSIGDLGAHGRYVKVTRQTLDKYQDTLSTAIQQLVGSGYGK